MHVGILSRDLVQLIMKLMQNMALCLISHVSVSDGMHQCSAIFAGYQHMLGLIQDANFNISNSKSFLHMEGGGGVNGVSALGFLWKVDLIREIIVPCMQNQTSGDHSH